MQLKKEKQEFLERNTKFHESLKNYEIMVLPSLDIPNVDGIPRIDIIEENLNRGRKKKDEGNVSEVHLINSKLVEYTASLNLIQLNRERAKGMKFDSSPSTLVVRSIGSSKYNKELHKRVLNGEENEVSDDGGLDKIPEDAGEDPKKHVDQKVLQNIIRNAMIARDE